MRSRNLTEGLEQGDLKRMVHPEMHIDEFKSKMGDDKDIVVITFKVGGKDPAMDLVNFIEKGYEFVIDADVSAGEMTDGDYIVFVEMERTEDIPKNLDKLMRDMVNLTEVPLDEWRMWYYRDLQFTPYSEEALHTIMPLTPEAYEEKLHAEQEDTDNLKTAAGVPVNTKAPDNEMTESLRIWAGIK